MHTAELMEALERSARHQSLVARDLMRDIEMRRGTQPLGVSRAMQRIREEIRLVAESDLTVLVMGETGVGKELVVRAIHEASPRRESPLLYLNCATLPETLAESELFGHTKGAFTGAHQERAGKFELANGGTVFLDEIGELPLSTQPKLLRAIEKGEIQRVGSNTTIHVDVRLLAATNRDLKEEVLASRFRGDLFHRLNVYPITVPPLRERIEDIPLLVGHFSELNRRRMALGSIRVDSDALDALCRYHWPGNVRELDNVLCRAILKASSGRARGEPLQVGSAHLGGDLGVPRSQHRASVSDEAAAPSIGRTFRQALEEFQRDLIRQAIERHQGNWAAAARDLGMHRSNFHHLAARLGLRGMPGP
jgi:anaerobic nitric oxide reductase transcription regulator